MRAVYWLMLAIPLAVGCGGGDGDKPDTGNEANADALSECGEQVIADSPENAFTDCFTGDFDWGACETCGYYSDVSLSQGAYDCITCPEGYEIEVAFGDCTGFCTPNGSSTATIKDSDCNPNTECVLD